MEKTKTESESTTYSTTGLLLPRDESATPSSRQCDIPTVAILQLVRLVHSVLSSITMLRIASSSIAKRAVINSTRG
jgi:hypothetical protein